MIDDDGITKHSKTTSPLFLRVKQTNVAKNAAEYKAAESTSTRRIVGPLVERKLRIARSNTQMRYPSNPDHVLVNMGLSIPHTQKFLPEPTKLVETDKAKNAVTHCAVVWAKMLPDLLVACEAL